jgi:ABC-type bacteriocin/lantibiotic exporter with double-glycine peptidase domain
MSKLLSSLLTDALARLKTPEARETLEVHILKPIISSVMELIYPYLMGVMILWVVMFVCVALILLILVRGSLTGLPLLILGKE